MPEVQPIPPHELEPSSPGHARSGNARSKRRRARRRRLVVGGVTTIALVAVAGGAYAFTRGDDTHYRTTTVTTGTVDQTISTTGTVASASRDDAAFSVAGTVGSVKVAVGDTVKAGQVLATLDTSDLDDAVDDAEDTLTTAKQQLADDLDAQTSSSSSSSTSAEGAAYTAPSGTAVASTVAYVTTVASTMPAATGTSGSTDDVAAAKKKVQAAQDALLAQYDTVKKALAASSDGITSSDTTCATFLAGTTTSGSGSTSSDGSTSTPSSTPSSSTGSSSDDDLAAALADCQDAVKSVLTDQQTVDDAQQKLLTLATDLDDAVAALQKAVAASGSTSTGSGSGSTGSGSTGSGSTGSGSGTPSGSGSKGSGSKGSGSGTPSGSGSTGSDSKGSGSKGSGSGMPSGSGSAAGSGSPGSGSTGSGSGSTGSGNGLGSGTGTGSSSAGSGSGGSGSGTQGSSATKTITAEQILADQAEIDLASSKVTIAKDARARYQLTSRISGTVAQVTLAKGDDVSASSSSAVVTVVGKDGYVVDATVPLTKVSLLKTGQTADVSVVGASKKLGGTVSSIGVVNQSETSTPSYTVSITLDDASKKLYDGSSAQLEIAVAAAKDATVVPTSAVTVSGTKHTVQVLKDGKATSVAVEVGAVGSALTQITSGLKKGETIVLADLSKDVTSGSDDSSSNGLSGLGGNQGGTGQVPGGGSGGFPGGFSGGGRP